MRRSSGHGRGAAVYELYGLRLKSDLAVPFDRCRDETRADVTLRQVDHCLSDPLRVAPEGAPWFQRARLPDGSDYLRWSRLYEFRVSPDGREILSRALSDVSAETFATYLLSQVLSFALVRQGVEPLHATATVVGGEAVAFLGDSGYGKSTLGAAFLKAGYPIFTDDLLVVDEDEGGFQAFPGPPRIKLLPGTARRLLGERARGQPMNPRTRKLILPLAGNAAWREPVRLRALYVLRAPGRRSDRVSISRLPARRACRELIRNTFNPVIVDGDRLARQLDLAARLVARVPVMTLSCPRGLGRLSEVVDLIRCSAA